MSFSFFQDRGTPTATLQWRQTGGPSSIALDATTPPQSGHFRFEALCQRMASKRRTVRK